MNATDELRSMAGSVGLAVPQAATLMMEAADTIDHLDAENAKLGEERREYQATIDSLVDECTDHKAENDRLREFAHGLIDGYECGRGELCEGCTWDGMSDPREFNCKVRAEARKLGVTADD